MDHLINDADYDDQEDDPIPPHVVKAMSKIAIYAATYGKDTAGWFLRDTTIAEPLAVVREWLKEWGYEFEDE